MPESLGEILRRHDLEVVDYLKAHGWQHDPRALHGWRHLGDPPFIRMQSGAIKAQMRMEQRAADADRATPYRLTGTTRYERGIQGDERTDYGGPAGRYDQMVSDDA